MVGFLNFYWLVEQLFKQCCCFKETEQKRSELDRKEVAISSTAQFHPNVESLSEPFFPSPPQGVHTQKSTRRVSTCPEPHCLSDRALLALIVMDSLPKMHSAFYFLTPGKSLPIQISTTVTFLKNDGEQIWKESLCFRTFQTCCRQTAIGP